MKSITSFSINTELLKKFNKAVPRNKRTETIEYLISNYLSGRFVRLVDPTPEGRSPISSATSRNLK